FFYAEGGTRTRMPRGATPSRWCVCQFHHFGFSKCALRGWRSSQPWERQSFTSSVHPEPARASLEVPEPSAVQALAAVVLVPAAAGRVEPVGPASREPPAGARLILR